MHVHFVERDEILAALASQASDTPASLPAGVDDPEAVVAVVENLDETNLGWMRRLIANTRLPLAHDDYMFVVLLIAVDQLAQIRDGFGIDAADRVVGLMAKRQRLRPEDLVMFGASRGAAVEQSDRRNGCDARSKDGRPSRGRWCSANPMNRIIEGEHIDRSRPMQPRKWPMGGQASPRAARAPDPATQASSTTSTRIRAGNASSVQRS